MSFTSVLKKIGTVILDGSQIASQVLGFPFVSQLLGNLKVGTTNVGSVVTTISSDFNTVASIISTAEAMFPSINGAKTGSAKLTAASPLVQQALQNWASSNLPGKKPKDLVLASKAAGEITQGFADFLNSYGD